MTKTKVAIYARYSSHNQREESIESQLRVCHDYAASHDMQIVQEYCDHALSGKTDKRPAFQRMIREAKKGGFEAVLVYTLDRFARNRYDAATYKHKLKESGIRVVSVTQPIDETPEGIILESVMEGMAEYYSANLSRNVRRGMDDNAIHGKSNGGLPLGYKAEDGRIVLDPIGAKAVQLIFDMYEADAPKAHIVQQLNAQGFTTRQGKPFAANSIWRILSNRRYTGTYLYKDVEIPDGMPRIIEQDQWDRVQEKIQRRKETKGHAKAMEEYLLSGKLFCGECGAPMVGESGKSANGEVYRYYKCGRKKHKGARACSCKPIRKDKLEKEVLEYISQEILTDENIKRIAAECYRLLDEEYQDKSLLEHYQQEFAEVSKKIDNILSAIEEGMYSSTLMGRLKSLEEKRDELECLIVSEQLKKPEMTPEFIEFCLYKFKGGHISDPDYSRGLIDGLLNSVFVFQDKEKGSGYHLAVALNLKNTPVKTLTCSDLLHMVERSHHNPNILAPYYKGYTAVFWR